MVLDIPLVPPILLQAETTPWSLVVGYLLQNWHKSHRDRHQPAVALKGWHKSHRDRRLPLGLYIFHGGPILWTVAQPKDSQLCPRYLRVNQGTREDLVGRTLLRVSWTLELVPLVQLESWGKTEFPRAVVMPRETVGSQGVVPTHCQKDGAVLCP